MFFHDVRFRFSYLDFSSFIPHMEQSPGFSDVMSLCIGQANVSEPAGASLAQQAFCADVPAPAESLSHFAASFLQQDFSSPTLHLPQHFSSLVHLSLHSLQQGSSLQQLALLWLSPFPSLQLLWHAVRPVRVAAITIITATIFFISFMLFI
jgi:hypothetical protein